MLAEYIGDIGTSLKVSHCGLLLLVVGKDKEVVKERESSYVYHPGQDNSFPVSLVTSRPVSTVRLSNNSKRHLLPLLRAVPKT